jgi:hypothetical protein
MWDVAAGRSFATLRPPSPVVAEVFTDDGEGLNKARFLPSEAVHEGRFWEVVRSLAPASPKDRE